MVTIVTNCSSYTQITLKPTTLFLQNLCLDRKNENKQKEAVVGPLKNGGFNKKFLRRVTETNCSYGQIFSYLHYLPAMPTKYLSFLPTTYLPICQVDV